MQDEAIGIPPIDAVLYPYIVSLLKGLDCTGILSPTQAPSNHSKARNAPQEGEVAGNNSFLRPLLDSVMSGNEHDMLNMFLNLKPPVFHGCEAKYAYEFILDYYDKLHKLGIVHQYGVKLVSFQLQGDPKIWWRAHMKF